LSGALQVRCSVAARTTVLAAGHPIGPYGTSAEFSAVPSETTRAVAYSLRGACWAAGRLYREAGTRPVPRMRLPSRPKRVICYEEAKHAIHKQKRAAMARAGQMPALRVILGIALAFGLASAGLSGALQVRCSVAARTTVLAAGHPIGPYGTSAEFSVVVGRVKLPTGP
jgi:hypothetical protein